MAEVQFVIEFENCNRKECKVHRCVFQKSESRSSFVGIFGISVCFSVRICKHIFV